MSIFGGFCFKMESQPGGFGGWQMLERRLRTRFEILVTEFFQAKVIGVMESWGAYGAADTFSRLVGLRFFRAKRTCNPVKDV